MRALVLGLAAVLVVCVLGGGAWAISALGGGGTQPDAVLPASALGYVRIDFDPAAGQKVALYRFAHKFPDLAKKLGSEDEDLRETLFDAIRSDADDLKGVDYARDVEPWLGDRMGVAAVPAAEGSSEPDWALAIQVNDEDKARIGIKKLAGAGQSYGIAFDQGYAVLAQDQKRAGQFVAAAERSSLSDNEQFTGDMDAVGETGIFSFWFDSSGLAAMSGSSAMGPGLPGAGIGAQAAQARVAGALRFDERYAELVGVTRGLPVRTGDSSEPSHLGQLPASTAVGLSFSGGGEAIAKGWQGFMDTMHKSGFGDQLDAMLNMAKDQYGIRLPQDLQTLLGKNVTLALDSKGLDQLAGALSGDMAGSGVPGQPSGLPAAGSGGTAIVPIDDPGAATGGPQVGAVLTTDPAKAKQVLDKLQQAIVDSGGPQLPLAQARSDTALAVASTRDYAKKLLEKGSLAKTEAFQLAIPDGDKSQGGIFVNLDALERLYLDSAPGVAKDNLEPLQALGISGSITGDGQSTFTVRVVAN